MFRSSCADRNFPNSEATSQMSTPNGKTDATKDPNPLHSAVLARDVVSVRALINQGHPVNEQDEAGDTPLHLAVEKGFLNIVQALKEAKADPNITNADGITPWQTAMLEGHARVAKRLLEMGARRNHRFVDESCQLCGVHEDQQSAATDCDGTTGRAIRMNRKRVRLWLGVSIAVFLAALLFYHMPYPLGAGIDHIDARGNFNDDGTEFNVSLYNGNRGVALQTIRIIIREKIDCRRRNDWPGDSIFTRVRRYRYSFKDAVTPLSARRFNLPVLKVTAPYDNCASPVYDSWSIEGGWFRLDLF